MKKKQLEEMKGMAPAELVEKARSLAEELMRVRFKKASGQLQTPHRLRELRRNIARVQTILSAQAKSQTVV
jgi:large subunit ribosomal protein L29